LRPTIDGLTMEIEFPSPEFSGLILKGFSLIGQALFDGQTVQSKHADHRPVKKATLVQGVNLQGYLLSY
jgi:hypothetical protein